MQEVMRDYIGCICLNEKGNTGIVSRHLVTDACEHLSWAGVDLFTGHYWESLHPKLIATNIDDWVAIKVEELLDKELNILTRKNLLT